MIRFWVAGVLLALTALLVLLPVSTGDAIALMIEPTPTVQAPFAAPEAEVVVETQGFGIPGGVILETDFGTRQVSRHDILGPNRYRDSLKVRLDSSMLWIFEHEGRFEEGRNDESWVLFPVIVPTPLTMTVSLHNPAAPCLDLTKERCTYVVGTGDQPVFILDQNKNYHIDLRIDYTRGANYAQDRFTVTSTFTLTATVIPVPSTSATVSPTASAPGTSATGSSGASGRVDLDKIFPPGKGRDLLLENCTSCHSFVRAVIGQRAKDAWEVVKRSMRIRVNSLSDENFEIIFAYLEANFNDTKPPPDLPDWLRSAY